MKIFKWLNFLKKNYNNSIPLYTKNSNPGLKIHIGCGNINLQGWLNIDARDFKHVHIISNGFDLSEFKEDSVAEFYLCHVLEHFSFYEANEFIKKLYNLLKPRGLIRVSVPDIKKLYILYNKQKKLSIIEH